MALAAVSAVAVLVVACQKEGVPEEPTDIYEQIGKLHDEGLNYVLQEIKKQPVTQAGGRVITDALIVNATADFMASRGYQRDALTKSGNSIPDSAAYNNVVSQLSERQQSYLNELFEIFDNKKLNAEEAIIRIKALENRIKVNCSAEEQPVLLCGTAVARYTIDYWEEHAEEWLAEIGGIEALQMYRVATKAGKPEDDEFSWKELGESDVEGAVVGAGSAVLGGAVVTIVSGGTLAGAAAKQVLTSTLRDALLASAADGVKQIWNKIF